MEKRLLYKYFNNQTTPQQELDIINWAEASENNWKEFLAERNIWDAYTIHGDTYDSIKRSDRSFIKIALRITNIAALIAIIIVGSWLWLGNPSPVTMHSIIVPPGQRVEVVLSDGTKVWLNSNTKFRYPSEFNKDSRNVELNGEGYFEVAKNAKKPFQIKTHKYNVQVLGTTFSVYAYDQASYFEASLFEGSVKVLSRETDKTMTLHPNEKVYAMDGKMIRYRINRNDDATWRNGMYSFTDEPMENLAQKLSVYFNTKIVIENPKLLTYNCTGKFLHNDGIMYILKVIQKDLKYEIIIDEKTNTITLK